MCFPSLASKLDLIHGIARTPGALYALPPRALITQALADGYANSGYVVINYGDPMVFIPSFTSDPTIKNVATQSTDIFNAYTNYVNGYNSRAFGPGDPVTESTLGFFYKEYLYLSRLGLRILRSGRQVLTGTQFQAYQYRIPTVDTIFPPAPAPAAAAAAAPAAAAAAAPAPRLGPAYNTRSQTPGLSPLWGLGGGLRPRRPLYSNDQGTHALRSLHDNDSGLRKRTRTRRTRRLRKSTRKSKTR